jgi:hypothetical protein
MMLGNLSVSQIETRLGIEFPAEIRDLMTANHQPAANDIEKGKWHCFDIPFHLVCGDVEIATQIYNSVKNRSNDCKELLQISVPY